MDGSCIFCAIAAGDAPAHSIYEDDLTIAFLSIHPAAPGHTLVVPREHAPHLWDLTDVAAAALGRSLRDVSLLLESELRPDGMTIFQTNRDAGWQSVFHTHFHLVPRTKDDELVPPWTDAFADEAELDAMSSRLRGATMGKLRPTRPGD
jgi:histidine triad (HIT) family protein